MAIFFCKLLPGETGPTKRWKSFACIIFLALAGMATIVLTFDSLKAGSAASFNILINDYRKQVSGIFKKAYENSDGSIDVIFNIPMGAEDLVRANASGTGIDKDVMVNPPQAVNVTRRSITSEVPPKPSRPTERMPYPLTMDRDFVINCPNICLPNEPLDYVIIVHSATAYVQRRQVMRQTFAAKRLFGEVHQAIVFLLGLTDDPLTTQKIKQEAVTYGDIVQGDFFDSYHNLTHKGVMGYRWVVQYCPQAKVILKLDDDVFLNPFKLVNNLLPMFRNKTRQIVCHVRPPNTSKIMRGKAKWRVAEDEFKGLKFYPFPYCNGYFVLISADIMRPMYQAVYLNPFFWIDDVYLFGLLPATIGNVKFVPITKNLTLSFNGARDCYAAKGLSCPIIASAQWNKREPKTLWRLLMELVPESVKKSYKMFAMS